MIACALSHLHDYPSMIVEESHGILLLPLRYDNDNRICIHAVTLIYVYICLQSMNWVHHNIMLGFVSNFVRNYFIYMNNISFVDSVPPKNIIYLLPSAFVLANIFTSLNCLNLRAIFLLA